MSCLAVVFVMSVLLGLTLNAGVFRYNPKAPSGSIVYNIYLEDKVMCLRACYEEVNCVFVTHEEYTAENCRLFENGDRNGERSGYILSREETDAACTLIEISDADIAFEKIPYQEVAEVECSNAVSDVAIISPYDSHGEYRFFVLSTTKVPDWKETKNRSSTPVFRRSLQSRSLERNLYFYDRAGRDDAVDSGLGQTFYIAGIENLSYIRFGRLLYALMCCQCVGGSGFV